jgi:acyl carrier protein
MMWHIDSAVDSISRFGAQPQNGKAAEEMQTAAGPLAGDEKGSALGYEPPQGETEQTLGAIWLEVLRVEHVGRHEDFFELGGNSLAATQLVSRIRASLGVEIPLRLMFEAPTIAGFAQYIGTIQWMSSDSAPPPDALSDGRTVIEL